MVTVEDIKRQILEASKTVVPVGRGCIYSVGADLVPYDHLADDGDTRWAQLYYARYRAIDPFHPRHFADSRESVFCTDDGGGPVDQRQEFVRGFRQLMGIAFKAEVFLRDRNGRIRGGIRLTRPSEMGDFRDWEVAALRTLQPVFSNAWRAGLVEARVAGTTQMLTRRENEVLQCMLDGMPNKRICRELNLALPTVKCYVKSILRKTGASSRADLIAGVYGGGDTD